MKKLFSLIRKLLKRQSELPTSEQLPHTVMHGLFEFERKNRGHQHLMGLVKSDLVDPSPSTLRQMDIAHESTCAVLSLLLQEEPLAVHCKDPESTEILQEMLDLEPPLTAQFALYELQSRLAKVSREQVPRSKDFRWDMPHINGLGQLVVYLRFSLASFSKDSKVKSWYFESPAINTLYAWRITLVEVMREMRAAIAEHESWPECSDSNKKSALYLSAHREIQRALVGYSPDEIEKITAMWDELKPRSMAR